MAEARRPTPVSVSTRRCHLRDVIPSDIDDAFLAWSADPEVSGPLNLEPRQVTREDFLEHLRGFDNANRFLIGIFDGTTEVAIGYYMILVDSAHRNATFHVALGNKEYWGKGIVGETRAALLDFFFERGIEKAVGMPLADNVAAIRAYEKQGWIQEGLLRGNCRSVVDGSRLDQYTYGLLKSEWLK